MNHWSKLHVAVSNWISDWILEVSQLSSYLMKIHLKVNFITLYFAKNLTQFKKFGLIINHAK